MYYEDNSVIAAQTPWSINLVHFYFRHHLVREDNAHNTNVNCCQFSSEEANASSCTAERMHCRNIVYVMSDLY